MATKKTVKFKYFPIFGKSYENGKSKTKIAQEMKNRKEIPLNIFN